MLLQVLKSNYFFIFMLSITFINSYNCLHKLISIINKLLFESLYDQMNW